MWYGVPDYNAYLTDNTMYLFQHLLLTSLLFLAPLAPNSTSMPIEPAAERTNLYLPMLQGKRVAVFANQTSRVKEAHLIDVLLQHHIKVIKIFSPEHGFRGDHDERINDSVDTKTQLPIISLYGKKLRPSSLDLKDIDVILFDIQDVGVRFYTYISSLENLMEAATDNNKPLIILDRPNPNGFYVDGPVLDLNYRSFTGMQAIPVVYGMTIGEYAKMLVGEEWLHVTPKSKSKTLQLTIVPNKYYTHHSLYEPPVKPSPNLPNIQSIYLYPSIGLMEGTAMSVGRGTDKPFQQFGHPAIATNYTFIPKANSYAPYPVYKDKVCHGWDLSGSKEAVFKKINNQLQIKYLIAAYNAFPDKKHFFKGFSSVAGNQQLEEQIKAGVDEKTIRKSWEPQLSAFKKIRKKYLIYSE